MAKYIKQEIPDLHGTGETKCYYRLQKSRNLSTKEFLEYIGKHGLMDDGVLKHALGKIADGEGPKRNAKSIEVKNVRYVSDKDLVKDVNRMCHLSRAGVSRVNRSPYSKEQRLKLLQDYLSDATHPFIRVADYAELTNLPRSSAAKELCAFAQDHSTCIDFEGRRNTKVYVKRVEI